MAEPKRRETIDMRSLDGLSYLQAVADQAPRLMARNDAPDALTDWWLDAITKLIAIAKEHASCSPNTNATSP